MSGAVKRLWMWASTPQATVPCRTCLLPLTLFSLSGNYNYNSKPKCAHMSGLAVKITGQTDRSNLPAKPTVELSGQTQRSNYRLNLSPHAPVTGEVDPYSEEAALRAGTLDNHFKPVPMTGGGLPDSRREVYDHHLSRPPHTGIVYTPPQYSDHIAVSVLIDRRAIERWYDPGRANFRDGRTKQCQPHLAQADLMSMWAGAKPSKPSSKPLSNANANANTTDGAGARSGAQCASLGKSKAKGGLAFAPVAKRPKPNGGKGKLAKKAKASGGGGGIASFFGKK